MVAITLSDPVVQSYIVYSAILAFKLLLLSPMTGATRMTRRVFANTEDAKMLKGSKVKYDDPVIERIRRAHLNDLENIPAFWVLGAFYVTTGPVAAWATLLFRVYTLGRILHTIVYAVVPLPQPARFIAFFFPALVSFYMASQVILYYITAL
uniref:Microsomal glutathione S-transferase 1 n=1 Tax=Heliothis virescens TaxID=7102 RepID=A0A2A4JUP6_HELVI